MGFGGAAKFLFLTNGLDGDYIDYVIVCVAFYFFYCKFGPAFIFDSQHAMSVTALRISCVIHMRFYSELKHHWGAMGYG